MSPKINCLVTEISGINFEFGTKAKKWAQVRLLYQQFITGSLQCFQKCRKLQKEWLLTCLGEPLDSISVVWAHGALMAFPRMWQPLQTNVRIRCGG